MDDKYPEEYIFSENVQFLVRALVYLGGSDNTIDKTRSNIRQDLKGGLAEVSILQSCCLFFFSYLKDFSNLHLVFFHYLLENFRIVFWCFSIIAYVSICVCSRLSMSPIKERVIGSFEMRSILSHSWLRGIYLVKLKSRLYHTPLMVAEYQQSQDLLAPPLLLLYHRQRPLPL